MQNALKSNELRRIRVNKPFKSELMQGDQIIHTFCKIGSPHKLGPPSFICKNLKILRKVLLNDAQCTEI